MADFTLKYDSTGNELVGEDPNGNQIPVPIESVSTDQVNNTHYVSTDDDGQAVIDGAIAGDEVIFKHGDHKPTTPYTIDKPLVIRGETTSVTGASPNPDSNIADWDGAAIEQQTAGENIFEISGISGEQVDFKNLLLTWESGIRDSDTGDGIHADAPDDADSSAKQSGLFGTTIENVWVHGNDGDSYGLYATNPQHLTINHFKVIGGGGIHFEQNHDKINYGNTLVMGFFCNLQNNGSAHGIYLHSISGLLNLLTWIRPQVNTNISDNSQQHLRIYEDGGEIDSQTYVGVNIEENNGNGGIDRPRGNATWLRARVGGDITNENSRSDVLNTRGETTIRDDFIRGTRIEATEAYFLQNDGGINPRVIQYNQANDRVQFRHTEATNSPTIQMYDSGLVGFLINGIEFAVDDNEVQFRDSLWKNPKADETGDGMTADPESNTEDGYVEVVISGTTYQIPIYQS